jgi:hypothetical protein
MSEVHTYIEQCIKKGIGPNRIVDVYAIAGKILRKFPDQTLRQVVDAVGAAVAAHRGNAMWDNDHQAATGSVKDRPHDNAAWGSESPAQKKALPGYSRQEAILYARDIIVDAGV